MAIIRRHFKLEYSHQARTVNPSFIGKNDSGWTIEGDVHEDWYEWVNKFKANHPKMGRVWGDFESIVYATSNRAFKHFMKNHAPDEWDYWDI